LEFSYCRADNVCVRSIGHGYFIEDGIETGNILERNIAIDIREGALLPSDSEASCFWITNPNNTIRYNGNARDEGNVHFGSCRGRNK
jgi:hypothetical protein